MARIQILPEEPPTEVEVLKQWHNYAWLAVVLVSVCIFVWVWCCCASPPPQVSILNEAGPVNRHVHVDGSDDEEDDDNFDDDFPLASSSRKRQ